VSEIGLNSVRIFLVDDHPAVRQGLSLLLSGEGLVVCGEAASREQTLKQLDASEPGLVLVDLNLGGESGLELIRELHAAGVITLVYSMHDDARSIESAFASGAQGYVTKREMVSTLLEGVRSVLKGQRYVSPAAAQVLAEKLIVGQSRTYVDCLSERELAIFKFSGLGHSTAEIADFLGISPRTVESYYARIVEKLKLTGMKAMRRMAIKYDKEG
jgi:two-component system, NarL family, invasion response regulator UvrY